MITVTRDSIRKAIGLKRIPKRFRMFVTGGWLYDVLKANSLHEKIHLWNQTYWVICRSLNLNQTSLTWRIHK